MFIAFLYYDAKFTLSLWPSINIRSSTNILHGGFSLHPLADRSRMPDFTQRALDENSPLIVILVRC